VNYVGKKCTAPSRTIPYIPGPVVSCDLFVKIDYMKVKPLSPEQRKERLKFWASLL
jgi:hypothetical protein